MRFKEQQESAELFYRRMINQKTGMLKPEILAICTEMNIEPDALKPKTIQEVKEQIIRQKQSTGSMAVRNRAPGSVDLNDDVLAETRFKHYNKRRVQALIRVQARLMDKQNRNSETPAKAIYDEDASIYKA